MSDRLIILHTQNNLYTLKILPDESENEAYQRLWWIISQIKSPGSFQHIELLSRLRYYAAKYQCSYTRQ